MLTQLIELGKYGFWGGVSTLINLLLFYIFITFGFQYIAANVISFGIAVVFSYIFNDRFVFKNENTQSLPKQIKFYITRLISIFVDSLLLIFLYENLGLSLLISKIVDSIIVIGSTFIINKMWIFKVQSKIKH
jgi:putative flippase GtrA